jgi:hypothetical protein
MSSNLTFTWRRAVALAAVLALASVGAASAQQFGSIRGMVSDDGGSALPGVTVTLEGIGAPRVTVSDEAGNYRFPSLDPGSYYIKAELDGFSTVEQPNVVVALNRATTINFTLSTAVEDVITVTSESPLLDERQLTAGANISHVELEKIPTGRDPWSVMNQAPGILTDRINVAGNEGGQQSTFLGLGAAFSDNDFLVDGVQITDMSATGASPTYYDFEQFEAVELSTGGADVTKSTSGVGVNMVTRRGTNEFRGTARFIDAKKDGLGFLSQSHSEFDCNDAGEGQDCESVGSKGLRDIREYGFEAGGPAIADRLWFWGSWGNADIKSTAVGGGNDDTILENTSVKLNAQITSANSFLASWNNGDKLKFGRLSGPQFQNEATWDQRGPSALWKFEDTHVFSSSFYLTGSYSKTDLGFSLTSKAQLAAGSAVNTSESLLNNQGIWQDSFQAGFSRRPEDTFKLDGSYFFNTGSETSHELKFGGRFRESTGASNFIWPGRNIHHYAGENFGNAGSPDYFAVTRQPESPQDITTEYTSLWAQDTIATGAWTFNAGLRWDLQEGSIGGATASVIDPTFESTLPTVTAGSTDPGFDWSTVHPRLGATYALGEDRDTLLRASFSMFSEALGSSDLTPLNPVGYSYAYYAFTDANGNDKWELGEPFTLASTAGFDPNDPTKVVNAIANGYDPEETTEFILGAEHSLLPEFVVGVSATWRNVENIHANTEINNNERTLTTRNFITGPGITDPLGRPWTRDDFVSEGMVCDTDPAGRELCAEVFGLRPGFSKTGGVFYENDGREREYVGLSLTLNKRLSNQWSLRGFFNYGTTEWKVPASYVARQDPNNDELGRDQDGAVFMWESTGSGRGNIFLNSEWQGNLTGLYQVAPDRPWGFNASANVYARQGYPVPWQVTQSQTGLGTRSHNLQGKNVDRTRLDDVWTTDLRVEKEFAATSNVSLTFGVDLFNAFNEATALARNNQLNIATAGWVQDTLAPRTWRLGLRVSWR